MHSHKNIPENMTSLYNQKSHPKIMFLTEFLSSLDAGRGRKTLNTFLISGTYYVPLTKSLFKSAGITVSHFYSMLPCTLKYLYSVEQVRMDSSIAHSIICTRLFRGRMHSD